MDELYGEFFRAMHQFRKLNVASILPDISQSEFAAMNEIMDKGEDGKITISELACKSKVHSSAISRTLHCLEEKGYIERSIYNNDRRNICVELTEEGKRVTTEARQIMCDYVKAVVEHLKDRELERLIAYMNKIYSVAEKEIEARKWKDRKGKEHE